jgi:hypothetical protein
LIDVPAIIEVGVGVLVALLVYFWQRNGTGSGRAFGNRIAAQIGIPKGLFHSLLDHGVKGSSRELLASLEKAKMGLDQASVALGPSLARGVGAWRPALAPSRWLTGPNPLWQGLYQSPIRSHDFWQAEFHGCCAVLREPPDPGLRAGV